MKQLVVQCLQGSKILFFTGLFHFSLIFCFVILLGIDSRDVNNENVWLKPLRFAFSIWLFTWTYAWFSHFIDKRIKLFTFLNHIIAICMFAEISLITFQAARGVQSHFNVETVFDAKVFSLMGAFIGLNAVIVAIWFLLFTFWQNGGKEYRSAIIWGMALFLLGNFSGYLIIRYGWPTDMMITTTTMPFTGWQSTFIDLKISHAVGLHAIQVLPLCQWLIHQFDLKLGLIHIAGLLYLIIYTACLVYAFG